MINRFRFLAAIIFLVFYCKSFAQQNFINIDAPSSTCKIVLVKEYEEKFKYINQDISNKNSKERKATKEIYSEIQENFIEKINNSDFICNDDLVNYLRGLMDEILLKNNIKGQDYKILLSKDSEVNAYNTGDGTIVINYGLFLVVANENELISVISHEIGHQFLNHVKKQIDAFVQLSTSEEILAKTKEIKRQKFGKATKANDLIRNIRYQNYGQRRKKEIEADSIGFSFYRKTLRNPKSFTDILARLDNSDIESDSLTVADYKFIFERNGFIIKQKYFEEEKSLFSKYDKDKRINSDSLKSHPDCATRIRIIEKQSVKSDNEFIRNSKIFNETKQNCIYQNLYNLYSSEKYGLSLYEALKLYKKNTDDSVLRNIIYMNLVKIHESRLNYTITRYVPIHDNLYNSTSLNRFVSYFNNIKISDFETIISNFKS